MKKVSPTAVITVSVAVLWAALLVGWHLYDPYKGLSVQAPGSDNRPEGTARKADDVVVGEFFMQYDEPAPTGMTDVWSGFRGPERTNILRTDDVIVTDKEYPVQWNVATGEGHAAPVVWKGRVFFLDYDETLSSDCLRCLSLETGKELWRR